MTQPILPQLEEIILDLTNRKAATEAQLAEIQSKLEAVKGVIPLFSDALFTNSPSLTSSKPVALGTKISRVQTIAAKQADSTDTKSAEKSISGSSKTRVARKTTSKNKKIDSRAATWQKYTRDNVGEQGISNAVRLILATQPEKNFKIAEVMSSLFEDDMPKTQYLKARNRISNILSGGVRDGAWYKGERGTYRLAEISN